MSDRFAPQKRSEVMSHVRGRNTGPERVVRRMLRNMGYKFRLHQKHLPGNPDIVFLKRKKAVFIHGCFWHGHRKCRRSARPTTNVRFWNRKIDGNIARDVRNRTAIRRMGWRILVLWQCRMKNADKLREQLRNFVEG